MFFSFFLLFLIVTHVAVAMISLEVCAVTIGNHNLTVKRNNFTPLEVQQSSTITFFTRLPYIFKGKKNEPKLEKHHKYSSRTIINRLSCYLQIGQLW